MLIRSNSLSMSTAMPRSIILLRSCESPELLLTLACCLDGRCRMPSWIFQATICFCRTSQNRKSWTWNASNYTGWCAIIQSLRELSRTRRHVPYCGPRQRFWSFSCSPCRRLYPSSLPPTEVDSLLTFILFCSRWSDRESRYRTRSRWRELQYTLGKTDSSKLWQ